MARIKYYNHKTEKWEYADSAYATGNVSQIGLTAEQIAALDNLFKITAFADPEQAADAYAAFKAAFALPDSGGSGDNSGDDDPGGDTGGSDDSGGEASDTEWTSVVEIGNNYTSGGIDATTGEVDTTVSGAYVSDYIEVPDGATSFSRITSRTSDNWFYWYDEEKVFIGLGLNATYSGNSTYGGGYTDGDGIVWNVIPAGAKYCRVAWRTSATYTSVSFKHNILLSENVTPEYGKIYYYTQDTEGTYVLCDYLRCDGMAYAHARPVGRRMVEFYDSSHSLLSSISTANNIGNNIAIPTDAMYLRVSNVVTGGPGDTSKPVVSGYSLIAFTETEATTW